jgi:UDP-2,3-diacylglucosamine pyrophosphatase LpxH
MGKKRKREVELVVLSDIHLGTYGCRSEELLRYLKTIKPKKIILNGDIIDMWQFSKRYWPKSHMQVILPHGKSRRNAPQVFGIPVRVISN